MNVEECLREMEEKAALLRYLASSATINPEMPDPRVLAGMADVCTEIEDMARAIKSALAAQVLITGVKRRR